MKLLQFHPADLRRQLAREGVWLRIGPFTVKIQSRLSIVADGLTKLYGQFEVRTTHQTSADFDVSVNSSGGLRHWLRPRAEFKLGGFPPIKTLPRDQAFSMLEWGLNWCVTTQPHAYLIIRAAAVEKNGRAAILLAPPDAGKSTLVAALVLSGWRLLSDEFTLINRRTGLIHPLPRPIRLRNQSIELVRQYCPDAYINRTSHNNILGAIAHMRPPRDSVRRQHETACPGWMIFPEWKANTPTQLTPYAKEQALMSLPQHAFEPGYMDENGMHIGSSLIDHSACHGFQYGSLNEAVAAFDQLSASVLPIRAQQSGGHR